ncbi:DUF4293 domain-containing protein [Pararhodonellum marinum]|uniref:DUF4293 domain-containing protein n=1 Tax=Pararhodonellum marinum TaxID=2755358 RepID=UPI00188E0BB4|nr:DUF4293 domain-containing protein [Pararhodonellum marinum]
MIQRVQTIFLFLVAVFMLLVTIFPIWEQVNDALTEQLKLTAWSMDLISLETDQTISSRQNIYIGLLALIGAGIAFYSLSQFKNRGKQMMLNMVNSLVMISGLGISIYLTFQANEDFNSVDQGQFLVGFYAYFAGMICNILANRFIRKDELLVRSVDRIR